MYPSSTHITHTHRELLAGGAPYCRSETTEPKDETARTWDDYYHEYNEEKKET